MSRWPFFLLGGFAVLIVAVSLWAAVAAAVRDDPAQIAAWGIGGVLAGLLVYEFAESSAMRE
jgi:putative flippase GtrA